MENRGLYVHLPFCASRCAYCDFFSSTDFWENDLKRYVEALLREAQNPRYDGKKCTTLYLGGGTPSLIGDKLLKRLVSGLSDRFGPFYEATLEANPADNLFEVFIAAAECGINRISLGVQSGLDTELEKLGRRHTKAQVVSAVNAAKKAGISNISLDLMLGIPDQTPDSLEESVLFLTSLKPTHISAYMLTLEENTPLYKNRSKLNLPSEEETCRLYTLACSSLERAGYHRYEVSNFARKGFCSQHNLNYWNSDEYVGLGAGAHGALDGVSYAYPPDRESFISQPEPIVLGDYGTREMYVDMRLRLCEGLLFSEYEKRFGALPEKFLTLAQKYDDAGLCDLDRERLVITQKGVLLTDKISSELVFSL